MPTRRTPLRAVTAFAVAAAVAGVVGACGGGADDGSGLPAYASGSSSSTTTTASPSPTSTGAASTSPGFPDAVPVLTEGTHRVPESAAPLIAAVVAYETSLLTGLHEGRTPDDLGAVAAGDQVGKVVAAVRDWKAKGWTLRGSMVLSALEADATGTTGTTGTVTGCLKDSTAAFRGGDPVATPKTTYFRYTAELSRRGSSWVVTSFDSASRGSCAV